MALQSNPSDTQTTLSNTDLAFERTILAHERTLMAWVRTAVSMISFGFTLYKFFAEVNKTSGEHQKFFTPRIVGMIMIAFGVVSLLLAHIQHQRALKRIKENFSRVEFSISSFLSVLVLMFGFALFLGALFRQ